MVKLNVLEINLFSFYSSNMQLIKIKITPLLKKSFKYCLNLIGFKFIY